MRPAPAQPLLLALAIALAGMASIALGQDANWDLLNYHLYNPWAWWTGRYGYDVAPALQSFHNPLADLPFYAMVAADAPPRVIAFVQAIPAGIAGYFVYRLAHLAFAGLAAPLAAIAVVAAVAVGVTGPNAHSMLGTTMNEWHTAALLMPALFLLARDVAGERVRVWTLVAAGFLAGAASGLKLTAAGYALAMAFALWAAYGMRRGLLAALVFGAAVLAGLAVTLGPWLAEVHALTGNPLFPYFNGVFGSPLLPADWTFQKTFGPRTLAQWLTLPFDLLRPPRGYVSEQRYRDARFPLVAALALVTLAVACIARARGRAALAGAKPGGQRALIRFLAVYFVAAFALWAAVHAIHRYLLALELTTGIALVALVLRLAPTRWRAVGVVATAALVVLTTRAPTWWRVPFGESFLEVAAPAIAPDALVLLHGAPLGFVLPAFPAQVRFAGIANYLVDERDGGLRRRVAALVAQQRGPLAVLVVRGNDPARALASFGLAVSGPCREVRNNLARFAIDLCPVERR